jgi:hypothetical protein
MGTIFEKGPIDKYFKVPHGFEKYYGTDFSSSEKYFFIILCKLSNSYGNSDGWFWHIDKEFSVTNEDGLDYILGFQSFGLSISTCKRARKKLREYHLIETYYGYSEIGHRSATHYRISWERFG